MSERCTFNLIGGPHDGGLVIMDSANDFLQCPRETPHGLRIDVYERAGRIGYLNYAGRFKTTAEYRRKTVKK